MFRHSDEIFDEIERFHRTLQKALTSCEKLIAQVQHTLPQWFRGPEAKVYDDGFKLRIELDAQGLSKDKKWAVRAVDRYLLLRGAVNKSVQSEVSKDGVFTKLLHLPSPVKRKPMTAIMSDDVVLLEFVKTTSSRVDDRWFEFTID